MLVVSVILLLASVTREVSRYSWSRVIRIGAGGGVQRAVEGPESSHCHGPLQGDRSTLMYEIGVLSVYQECLGHRGNGCNH